MLRKKVLFILFTNIIMAQIVTEPDYQMLQENREFIDNQKKWVHDDLHKKFQKGLKSLSVEHFEVIRADQIWRDINTKIDHKINIDPAAKKINKANFKKLLKSNNVPKSTRLVIKNILKNNNLYQVLNKMHQFGFTQEFILQFRKFIIALLYPGDHEEIETFSRSVALGKTQATHQFLLKGFRPDWLVAMNLRTGLALGIISRDINIVKMFLQCPNIDTQVLDIENMNALMQSVKSGNEEIAKHLLEVIEWDFSHTNIHGQDIFKIAQKRMPTIQANLAQKVIQTITL